MLKEERLQAIYEYIHEQKFVHVAELSQAFFISETSIRRDLTKLENSGLIKKTYGGALIKENINDVLPLKARANTAAKAKNVIAEKAKQFIRAGDVIFMDSSSTVLALVPHLKNIPNLTVITHGLKIACDLVEHTKVKVYCLGGLISTHTYSANGMMTIHALQNMRANKFFVSPKGISHSGVYCASEEEAEIRRIMLEHSDETYLLCSVNKFDQTAVFQLCSLDRIKQIITDEEPEEKWKETFEAKQINMIY